MLVHKRVWAEKILGPKTFWLDLSDLTNPNLTWPVKTWFDLSQLDFTCPDIIFDPNLLDRTCPDLTRPDLTCPWLDLPWLITRLPFGHPIDTLQTPLRHPPGTFQTPLRHPPDTHQTPVRNWYFWQTTSIHGTSIFRDVKLFYSNIDHYLPDFQGDSSTPQTCIVSDTP